VAHVRDLVVAHDDAPRLARDIEREANCLRFEIDHRDLVRPRRRHHRGLAIGAHREPPRIGRQLDAPRLGGAPVSGRRHQEQQPRIPDRHQQQIADREHLRRPTGHQREPRGAFVERQRHATDRRAIFVSDVEGVSARGTNERASLTR